jgi:hypothetical protein
VPLEVEPEVDEIMYYRHLKALPVAKPGLGKVWTKIRQAAQESH